MSNTCVICQADFTNEGMIGKKCTQCHGLYPDADTLEDLKEQQNKDRKNRHQLLNEPVIRELIYEVLEEAGIVRKRCVVCKAKFLAKSPAQKSCDVCRKKAQIPKVTTAVKKDDDVKKDSKEIA